MTSEAAVIAATDRPNTVVSLTANLGDLGLAPGDVAIVHSSLSALGWVAGGPQAVVEALLRAVGDEGTIVMPTQSGQLSDPTAWSNPPVPPEWIPILRDATPAYSPRLTPTRAMGAVVECFRSHERTRRSAHPTVSFAANGPLADAIVGAHPLTPGLGDSSPLGRLYELDAKVLLLGVGHANNTSLHLAEHRADWPGRMIQHESAPVWVDGGRRWVTYQDLQLHEDDFDEIGAAFASTGRERTGAVGQGVGRICAQRAIVDFAVEWMEQHRGA